jgi:repressor lexA
MKQASTKPSKRQAEILNFIGVFQKTNKYSPSLAEIAEHFSVSIPTVHQHVSHLKGKGLLSGDKGARRAIEMTQPHSSTFKIVNIPLLGTIAAGGPIEAIRTNESIDIPSTMVKNGARYYALRVSGISMIEEGISDGDIVIVRDQSTVENGEKAVVYLPEKNAVTLKKLYQEASRTKLVPANSFMKPFYEDNVEVQGKVVGVIRREV